MGFVGQLVRCNILCKKTVPLLEIPSEMKWGHLELHRDLFLWVSTVNEKKKKYKENEDTSPELQEYKSCLPFFPC